MEETKHQTRGNRLLLLGPPRLLVNGDEPALRRKTLLLLVYLAETGRSHTRRRLLRIFCPTARDPRATLRNLLSRVRRKVDPAVLTVDDNLVAFNQGALFLDVVHFSQRLAHPSRTGTADLRAALALYRGEFAAGLEADDLPEVALWLLGTRIRLQNLYERGLSELLSRLRHAGENAAAIDAAQRLLQVNPLNENAHGQLIRLYADTGRLDAARSQYDRCRRLLERELSVSPSPELEQVADAALARGTVPTAVRPPQPALREAGAPLLGRKAALAALDRTLQDARAGRGQVVLLEGNPGTGKTFLARTFARRRGVPLLSGEAYETEQAIPYGPWRQVIEARAAQLSAARLRALPDYVQLALRRLVPGLGTRLRDAIQVGARLEPDNLHYALADFLLQPDADRAPPIILFLDNLQWADHASRHLFHFLARRAGKHSLLLLGAWHPPSRHEPAEIATWRGHLAESEPTTLFLNPLNVEELGELLVEMGPKVPLVAREALAERLHVATGGNPYFATEVIREMDAWPRTSKPPADPLPLPHSIRALMTRRLRALPAGQRQVVEAIAVVGDAVRPAVAQQVSGRSEEETLLALDGALGQNLLLEVELDDDLEYAFVHDLARRSVLDEMSGARRRALHRRAARVLRARGAPWARVAAHWRAAGDQPAELDALRRAIEEAQVVFANEALRDLLLRAVELEEEPLAAWSLRHDLAQVAMRTGRWEEALANLEYVAGAAQSAGRQRWLARTELERGRLHLQRGAYDDADRSLRAARTHFDEANDAVGVLRVEAELSHLYFRRGKLDEAKQLAEETAGRARADGETEVELRALGAFVSVLIDTGRFDGALFQMRRRRDLAREMGNPIAEADVLTEMSHVAYFRGDFDDADQMLEQAMSVHRRAGNLTSVARLEGNKGLVAHKRGDLDQALAHTERALVLAEELQHEPGIALHAGNLAFMHTFRREYAVALDYFSRALTLDETLGHREAVLRHLGNRGVTHYHMGLDGNALEDFTRALAGYREQRVRHGESHVLGDLGLLYGRRGSDEEALSYMLAALEIDLALENRDGCARHLGNAARVYRRRGHLEESLACCRRAVELERQMGARHMLASDLETLADLTAARGDLATARQLLKECIGIARDVERMDSEAAARSRLIGLRHAAGELSRESAITTLATLLDEIGAPRDRVRVWETLVDVEPESSLLAGAAAEISDAYAKLPAVWFRTLYRRLTSRQLPPPAPLPPGPAAGPAAELDTLLAQADRLA